MTRIELCRMCNEYSIHSRCEYRKTCKLQKVLTDNAKLRADNKKLKEENKELKDKVTSYEWKEFPDMMGK
uniref:Uncharacterized protein n=1 Tax=virus sp. ctQ5V6 TaxID=2825815 RepID=A0A8S5RQT9_9VIRU|nr:MAG TPA: hypothetical protein [virus sp. ctQ5V6]